MRKRIAINDETIVTMMKRLLRNNDYQLLQELWFRRWDRAQRDGKKLKREIDWAFIEGFDAATEMAEKWANKKTDVNTETEELE